MSLSKPPIQTPWSESAFSRDIIDLPDGEPFHIVSSIEKFAGFLPFCLDFRIGLACSMLCSLIRVAGRI